MKPSKHDATLNILEGTFLTPVPAPPRAQLVQERLLLVVLGWLPLGQLGVLGSNIPAGPGEVRGPGIPEESGGMGLEGAGELAGTLSECTYGNIGDGAWGPGHFPAYDWALWVMLGTGQRRVTAVHADSQHDPVSLLSAAGGAEQAPSSQPGTEDDARQNLS